ncbi:zinc-binding oxidoreductase alcohol dehydrogenase [Xylogone sp. PMI_703]|nr:zinc-binding oxidoreductase alcohol dehydrogenase [Xylogone sp. PMI_703]
MSPQNPPVNNAILKTGQSKATLSDIPIPSVHSPDNASFILIRTIAVAMNPTDWQTLDEPFVTSKGVAPLPQVMGCDAAGIVVEVGTQVTKRFQKGDRVFGASHGGNILYPQFGTYANYILIKGDTAVHIPPHLSFEEASTLPCGLGTVSLGLYKYLKLPLSALESAPDGGPSNEESKFILIYGGSSATGTLAIQFAQLSQLTVITTCSKRNFNLVKSLGADYVFDYHDPESPSKIHSLTNGKPLTLIFDTIATDASAKFCAGCFTIPKEDEDDITYVSLLPVNLPLQHPSNKVKEIFFLGYTIFNLPWETEGEPWDADPEDFALCVKFCGICKGLLQKKLIKPHPILLKSGGLEALLNEGFELMREGVSGVKVVYRIAEE